MFGRIPRIAAIFAVLLLVVSSQADAEQHRMAYSGALKSTSYSELSQINSDNVHQLEVAWIYNSGDERRPGSQTRPIIVDDVMYLTTPGIKVAALDAATGELIWSFDPFEGDAPVRVNRGVTYWADGSGDRRIFHVAGSKLYSLNADTGELVKSFGVNGSVDFTLGLGRDASDIFVTSTSPGVVYNDLFIVGSTVSNSAPGHIRAYNVHTGEIEWTFHTIPRPGEYGYDTWPEEAWTRVGNANSWAGMSLDEERGMVYAPTASPGHDFYGGDRHGKNLFSTTLLALDASTGERIWHYQVVRHDIWDIDLAAPPHLVTIERGGEQIDAVAQVTKHGFTFVLDRETGTPLFPVEERPVPASPIDEEAAWPTQRFPVLPEPFTRQYITEDDLTNVSPEARAYALERFREVRYEGPFTPVGTQETLAYPGTRGGANWGGSSFDPETNFLYVNANEFATTASLQRTEVPSAGETMMVDEDDVLTKGRYLYATNCASCHGSPGGRAASEFPSLYGADERFSEAQLLEIMRSGQGSMPPFPHLSEEEKEAIVTFLRNPGEEGAAEPAEGVDLSGDSYTYTADIAYQLFVDPDGYFLTKPPWGSLNAINLNTGEIAWKVPLGEYEELTERGIPVTGTQNLGGSVVTAGGLVFIGATHDEKFRAFDKYTGEVLWEYDLPAAGDAFPAVYEIHGKQFVVIPATGGSRVGINSSDSFIAFSLPET